MPDINFQTWDASSSTILTVGDEFITLVASLINGNVDSAWTEVFTGSTTETYTRPSALSGPFGYTRRKKIFSRSFQGETWFLEMYNTLHETLGALDGGSGQRQIECQYIAWTVGKTHTAGVLTDAMNYRLMPIAWTHANNALSSTSSDFLSVAGGLSFSPSTDPPAVNHVYATETAGSLLISINGFNVNPDNGLSQPVVYFNSQFIFVGELDNNYPSIAPFALASSSVIQEFGFAFYSDSLTALGVGQEFNYAPQNGDVEERDLSTLDTLFEEVTLFNTAGDTSLYPHPSDRPSTTDSLPSKAQSYPTHVSAVFGASSVEVVGAGVDGILTFPVDPDAVDLSRLLISGRPETAQVFVTDDVNRRVLISMTGTDDEAWRGANSGGADPDEFNRMMFTIFGGFSMPRLWGFGPYNV